MPFVLAGPACAPTRRREFGELTCARGILGHLRGPDLMPVLLNAADRPLFLGSRPTPFDGADGYPSPCSSLTAATAPRFSRFASVDIRAVQVTRRPVRLRARAVDVPPVAIVSAFALYVIIVSGATVRLTGSGLGCEGWPGCAPGPVFPEKDYHPFVEFGNRVVAIFPIMLSLATAGRVALPPAAARVGAHVRLGSPRSGRSPRRRSG